MYTLLFRHFDSSQEAKFSDLVQMKASFLRYLVFFSCLEGYYFSFANIFVMSVLRSYTVVMKQRHLKHDLVVSLDL